MRLNREFISLNTWWYAGAQRDVTKGLSIKIEVCLCVTNNNHDEAHNYCKRTVTTQRLHLFIAYDFDGHKTKLILK